MIEGGGINTIDDKMLAGGDCVQCAKTNIKTWDPKNIMNN